MRISRAAIVLGAIAVPIFAASAAVSGCDQGTPASPTSPLVEAGGVVICPTIEPNFASIRSGLLQTNSCGAGRSGSCHSSGGATYSGWLDYSVDASALYEEFLGDAGTGHIAQNVGNTQADRKPVYRVIPGDAGASLLYIKLTLTTGNDPDFGSGMPLDHVGSLCPADIKAVGDWINGGAQFTDDQDAEAEDADTLDARADAQLDAGDAAD